MQSFFGSIFGSVVPIVETHYSIYTHCIFFSQARESHRREHGLNTQTRVQETERSRKDSLIKSAERLCTSLETRCSAVLERMGLSKQKTLPSFQPPALTRRSSESSLQRRSIRKDLEPSSNLDELWNKEDPFFEEKLHLASKAAVIACKLAKLEASNLSPVTSICSVDSSSTVDTHTPSELRSLSQVETPISSPSNPTPPPTVAPLARRASRLPLMSANLSGACKFI